MNQKSTSNEENHRVVSDIRAEVGKFCLYNCFQEALVPVLKDKCQIDDGYANLLRFITVNEIAEPMGSGTDPGLFGGVSYQDMTSFYRIGWWRPELYAQIGPDLIEVMSAHGPLIVITDPYHLPTDAEHYEAVHTTHTILIVEADREGIGYSDVNYLTTPARISWETLRKAVLSDPDGRPFAWAVSEAQDLPESTKRSVLERFEDGLRRSLSTETSDVAGVFALTYDSLVKERRALEKSQRQATSHTVSYLNSVAHSFANSAILFGLRTSVPENARSFAEAVSQDLLIACRRSQMFFETGNERHLKRVTQSLSGVRQRWESELRAEVVEGLNTQAPK